MWSKPPLAKQPVRFMTESVCVLLARRFHAALPCPVRCPALPCACCLQSILKEQHSRAAAAGGKPPASACKALGLSDPNVKWGSAESARVLLLSTAMYLEHRGSEVSGKAPTQASQPPQLPGRASSCGKGRDPLLRACFLTPFAVVHIFLSCRAHGHALCALSMGFLFESVHFGHHAVQHMCRAGCRWAS